MFLNIISIARRLFHKTRNVQQQPTNQQIKQTNKQKKLLNFHCLSELKVSKRAMLCSSLPAFPINGVVLYVIEQDEGGCILSI